MGVNNQNQKKEEVKYRLMIEPDATCQTIRARRKGFIGTVKTNLSIFETDLYIFDTTSGVQNFCMANISYLDNKPNKKNFPKDVYRVYSLKSLGLDGMDVLSLYYGGMRQTLRYVGHKPRRYVIHDKFVFRVKYNKQMNAWLYLDPISNTFRTLPFEPTELSFYREDFQRYKGELPRRFATKPASQMGMGTGAPSGVPLQPTRQPIGAPQVGRPQVQPQPQASVPVRHLNFDAPVRTQPAESLYVLKVKYVDINGNVKGYGAIAPNGEKKKLGVSRVIQLAQENKVKGVKVVDRGTGPFLQGVGQALETLPTKVVNQ